MIILIMILFRLMILRFWNKNRKLLIQNYLFILIGGVLSLRVYEDWRFVSYYLSIDKWSYYLVLLSLWISSVIFIFINNSLKLKVLIILLILFIIGVFITFNIILFYIFFEISLIPIFLIVVWLGGNYNRIEAALYIIVYTLIISLPLIFILFNIGIERGRYIFRILESGVNINGLRYVILIRAILVKLPIFLLHLWLPKAHVEAPVYGSIILAGVLLKLGGYGLMRLIVLCIELAVQINSSFIRIRIVGIIFIGLVCLNQIDIKILVAYSSVVHIGLILVGIMTIIRIGILGGYIIIIGHGLCSSGLFYLVNVLYERVGSRLMFIVKGRLRVIPIITIFWFLFCISNLAAPMSLNLLREIFLINSILNFDRNLWVYILLYCFLRAFYRIYLYRFVQHGEFTKLGVNSGKISEFLVLILHWVPLNLLFLNLDILIYLNSLIKIRVCGALDI